MTDTLIKRDRLRNQSAAGGLTPGETGLLAEMFRLLGDPSRLRILMACLDEAKAVGQLSEALELSPSLVSHHLRLLRQARLVRGERRGKYVYYRAADDHVRSMLKDMAEHASEERQSGNE